MILSGTGGLHFSQFHPESYEPQQRAHIKIANFLTVEDSLQLVGAKRRSCPSGAAGGFNIKRIYL